VRTLPDPIGAEVRRELDRFGPAGKMGEIVSVWPQAVAANAWPARVARDGTLHVHTASSTWAFELAQLSDSVLSRLRERLGEDSPVGLRFAVGPLPELGEEVEKLRDESAPKPTAQHVEEAARIAAPIADPALREVVSRAISASLAAADSPPADRPV
jgi:Dna[CI] antecedent DciA-like protein